MFTKVTDKFFVFGQISKEHLSAAHDMQIETIICNRPDGEEGNQPSAAMIADASESMGMRFHHIPVGPQGISQKLIDDMKAALEGGTRTLAYCRSGTRSITLWAYACAASGGDVDELIRLASEAGYNLNAHRSTLENLASSS